MLSTIISTIYKSEVYALVTNRPVIQEMSEAVAKGVEIAKALNLYATCKGELEGVRRNIEDADSPEFAEFLGLIQAELEKLPVLEYGALIDRVSLVDQYVKFSGGQPEDFSEALENRAKTEPDESREDYIGFMLGLFDVEKGRASHFKLKEEFGGLEVMEVAVSCATALGFDEDLVFALTNVLAVSIHHGIDTRVTPKYYDKLCHASASGNLGAMLAQLVNGGWEEFNDYILIKG